MRCNNIREINAVQRLIDNLVNHPTMQLPVSAKALSNAIEWGLVEVYTSGIILTSQGRREAQSNA
jgi:hypothetical protein